MSLRLGLVLVAMAIGAGLLGYQTTHPGPLDPAALVADFYTVGASALLAAGLSVLILGISAERRQARRELTLWMRLLSSGDNELALEAVEELHSRGALYSGALNGARLTGANLEGAYLWNASLRGTNLSHANLAGAALNGANLPQAHLEGANLVGCTLRAADLEGVFLGDANLQATDLREANLHGALVLTHTQLVSANKLRGATMPEGDRYDGRYRLPGDLRDAYEHGIRTQDPLAMAHWYGVPPGDYARGQHWAEQNLANVQAGLNDAGEFRRRSDTTRDIPISTLRLHIDPDADADR